MPKAKFNVLVESLSGRVGNLIYYQADGQNLVRKAPEAHAKRTKKQNANSDRFLAAQKYAAAAMSNAALKAAYKAACRGHQNPRNLAIRDAMCPPVIESINLDEYTGKP